MTRRLALVILALVASTVVTTGHAQGPDRNNAWTYYQIALRQLERVDRTQLELVTMYDPSQAPSAEVRAALETLRPIIAMAERGAQRDYNDLNLDYSAGPGLQLPHLAQMRNLTRVLGADAHISLYDGNSARAAEIIANGYRMSDHVAGDHVLISSLVGNAMHHYIDRAAQFGLDRAVFTAEDGAALLQGLESNDISNPFQIKEAMRGEADFFVGWMIDNYGGEGGYERALTELPQWVMPSDDSMLELVVGINNQAEMDYALQQASDLANLVADTLENAETLGQATDELQLIEEALENGDYGPLAHMLFPSYGRVIERLIEHQDQTAQRIVQLRDLASGEVEAAALANAAVWYLRAVQRLDDLAAEQRVLWEALPEDPLTPLTDEEKVAVSEVHAIVHLVHEGSRAKLCDFEIANASTPSMRLGYAAGLRDVGRLVVQDATRKLRAGDLGAVAVRVSVLYRLSAHLGQDQTLISALVAHHLFMETEPLVPRMLAHEAMSADVARGVDEALRHIERRDPFGYRRAMMKERETLRRELRAPSLPERDRPRTEAALEKVDADQLAYLIVGVVVDNDRQRLEGTRMAREAAVQAAEAEGVEPPTFPELTEGLTPTEYRDIDRLEGILDLVEYEIARESADQIVAAIRGGRIELLEAMPRVRVFARIVERMEQATPNLAVATKRLRPYLDLPQVEQIETVSDGEDDPSSE